MSDHHHHPRPVSPVEARVAAIESILSERGLVNSDMIDATIQGMAESFGPMNGARVVARAWSDQDFHDRLLEDPTAALQEADVPPSGEVAVVENTATVHNVVVCTLCSCYPWSLLGIPPTWYKSLEYRSSMVRSPRATLKEMGTELPENVEVRVWDSSAEVRYLVLPERPSGTEGLDERQLADLVTRDSMIGVEKL
jgi:nitrile hydratase subunit alpha